MIDWNKPIETVDGRKALVIGSHPEPRGHPYDEGYFVPRMVWVESTRSHLFGDVFLVMPSGVRCDDTAWRARPSVPEVREPIIRNARVKREGWVNIYHVHKTEAAAIQCRSQNEGVVTRFVRWEE